MVGERILVVEDEVIVARTITNQLEQLGYTVVGKASSGNTAIAKALSEQPDLILMDVFLKGNMDGITAASQIREQIDVPIVFLTAYADNSTVQRAKATLPLGYIVKPFNETELRIAIELALFKHQTDRELRQNREYLATLLRSMHDGVIATDSQGQINFMNPAAEALTGWRETEAFGRSVQEVWQLVDEVTNSPLENPVGQVLHNQQVTYLQDFIALVTRNGDRIPIGDSISPIHQPTEGATGAVIVFYDLSDRRQAEQLTKALEKEQELNHLKSQFVSTVSHEFRNPLAVIRTAAELLDVQGQAMSQERIKSYLKRIKDAVKTMNRLMEDVLIMGRVEADRLPCEPVLLDLETFCQNLVEECNLDLHANHQIHFQHRGNCAQATLDENLLRYILTNLLTNALKYSPNGGNIQLTLLCDPSHGLVQFQVQDQGIGIPPHDQAHLFDSFYRASNVGNIEGTGLGLAIVKKCVDLHQGHITLASTLGQGTTVTVTLPLHPNL